jgi:hypothetical protein
MQKRCSGKKKWVGATRHKANHNMSANNKGNNKHEEWHNARRH